MRGALPQSASKLVRFVPELERIDAFQLTDRRRGDVWNLEGFDRIWAAAAEDPLFRAAQKAVAGELYFTPALQFAASVGLNSPLARAALIDAIVQHGGDDPNGLPAMLAATEAALGRPTTPLQEREWLDRFLSVREAVLQCANAERTRRVWRESVSRVDGYRQRLRSGNLLLEPPLVFELDELQRVLTPAG